MSEFQDIMITINQEQLVSNIERIISSYRHPWDIYTELLQNSTDAIIEEFGYQNINKGKLELEIYPDEYKIIISDNGCGIEPDNISRILFVGESLKRKKKTGKYGFMGFGLTFVAFQTEEIIIESYKDGTFGKRTYQDLYKFIYEDSALPESEEEKNNLPLSSKTSHPNGTKIALSFPNNMKNLARANDLQHAFKYAKNIELFTSLLKTKTAVGFIDRNFNNKAPVFEFSLKIDKDTHKIEPQHFTYQYMLNKIYPTEKRIYDIDKEYPNHLKSAEKLPKETQAKFTQAFLLYGQYENIKIGERDPINARFIIYALSKRHIGKYNNIMYKDDSNTYQDSNIFKIDNGVWLALNGIPTGIRLDTYDHPNFLPFTVIADIQDDYISKELDAGRKGISELRKQQIVKKAKEFLDQKNFLKYRSNVLNENATPGPGTGIGAIKNNPLAYMKQKVLTKEIHINDYVNMYLPPLNEQEVISLFIELLVLNEIRGYKIKMLSSNSTYDALLEYNITRTQENLLTDNNYLGISEEIFINDGIESINREEVVVEFKYKLSNIFPDLDQRRKKISDINILVCWDTENNDNKLEEYGYYITQKDHTDTIFYGVTHDVVGSEGTLKIIELKTVLKNIKELEFS